MPLIILSNCWPNTDPDLGQVLQELKQSCIEIWWQFETHSLQILPKGDWVVCQIQNKVSESYKTEQDWQTETRNNTKGRNKNRNKKQHIQLLVLAKRDLFSQWDLCRSTVMSIPLIPLHYSSWNWQLDLDHRWGLALSV